MSGPYLVLAQSLHTSMRKILLAIVLICILKVCNNNATIVMQCWASDLIELSMNASSCVET